VMLGNPATAHAPKELPNGGKTITRSIMNPGDVNLPASRLNSSQVETAKHNAPT
jgi:hypothetical protein